MHLLRKFLRYLTLQYADPVEEQEYFQIRMPLVKDFFLYLFMALTGILTPYTIRFYLNGSHPYNIIFTVFIAIAIAIFIFKRKLTKHLEPFLVLYIIATVVAFTIVLGEALVTQVFRDTFYAGYGYAMIPRLVGYRVLNIKYMGVLYVVFLALKFPLIPTHNPLLIIIIVLLDTLTIALSFVSEKSERNLFDTLYKTKKDILKFKHLITKYLPNQIAVLSTDTADACYMNNAFKRSFKCENITSVKEVLTKYSIEKETLNKDKGLFFDVGFVPQLEEPNYTLTKFLECLSKHPERLLKSGLISFPVIEDEKTDVLPDETQLKGTDKENKETLNAIRTTTLETKPNKPPQEAEVNVSKSSKKDGHYVAVDVNETVKSDEKGSSDSNSSDFALEEGRRRVYKVKIFPIMWDDQQAIGMVFDDITQQRIIMELKIADKNKDLVIAMVSHELRTPLNGMLGLLDIAKKHIEQGSAISYINACKNSGILMLNLVNSILDLNQIKNKKLRLVFVKFSLFDLLKEIKGLFDYFCLIKNLYLKIEVAPNVPKMITTDKNRLSQIIVNLVGNAFKFTFRGGVTVKVDLESREPCRIRFSIQDTGIGIKKEDQSKLFKMYGRLDQEDQKINTQGIGLGLTIANTLAMLLNPENKPIQVESEVKQGTSFSFVVQAHGAETISDEFSLADISSLVLHEDRDFTVMKKMSVYTNNNNHENFSKMIMSSQNLDSKQFLSPNMESKPLISNRKESPRRIEQISSSNSNLGRLLRPTSEFSKRESSNKSYRDRETEYKIIEEEREHLQEDREDQEEKIEKGKPWCLVVDDNPFNLMVACHIMEERGYRVKTGLNGEEAIQKAKEHKNEGFAFKVVLMDCQMPVMDGYEATKILRGLMKDGEIAECPIIALTANSRDDDHDKLCKDVGMTGHVSKPLQIDELESVLKLVQQPMKK